MTYQAPERKTGYLKYINDEKGWGKAELEDGSRVFLKRQDFRPNADGIRVFPVEGTKLTFIVMPSAPGKDDPHAIDVEVVR